MLTSARDLAGGNLLHHTQAMNFDGARVEPLAALIVTIAFGIDPKDVLW